MKLHKVPNPLIKPWPIYLQVIILFSINPNIDIALGNYETDALALLELKKSITEDPYGMLTSWNRTATHNLCNWQGVSCSHKHVRVAKLDLQGLSMKGSISPRIGNLSFLRFINLGNNSFSGEIPPEIGRLFRLQHLNLTNNAFTGQIPAGLSNCSELEIVEFGNNKLIGRIPEELGSLTKLVYLQLGKNNLTGTIPPSLGNLSSLRHFSTAYNHLVGSIPDDFGRLRSLSILAVAANELSGIISPSFYNISSITIISTASNRFRGSLPSTIGLTLPNLQLLAISSNQLSGPIPLSLTNASKLQALVLSTNYFSGAVPSNVGNILTDLWWLGFGNNNLGSNSTGDLDFLSSLKNCSRLKILDFSSNQFGGVLPAGIANLSSQLSQLYLGNNQLYGAINGGAAALEKYTDLNVLDMEGNLFAGTIPSYFGRFHKMEGMSLSGNRLYGPIPSSFGNLTRLSELYLSENELEGSIPPSIGNCKSLQYLDISQNNLAGVIPKQLTDLSSLSLLLNLSHNSLTGNIPAEIGNLRAINSLDVSANHLFGKIPETIGGCISLEYLSLQGNNFEGSIPSSLAALKGLKHLDLSRNNLSGNIPKDLQDLMFLIYLNISFNDLEGEVPKRGAFGNSSAISIVGNSNRLCGGVPELHIPACPIINIKRGSIMSPALRLTLIVVVSAVLPTLLLSYILALLCWRRKLRNGRESSSSSLTAKDLGKHQIYKVTFKMLYQATNGFASDNLVGFGSFGSVYKGLFLIPDAERIVVAVKVLDLRRNGASKSFLAECKALRNIRHRNLVKIITSCSSLDYNGNEFKALVFEFMENASLDEWLHPKKEDENIHARNLNLIQLLNIAMDVAYAFHYLHHQCQPPVVHCDLKPSNVLLDTDMVAHVGDFGISRLLISTNSSNGVPHSNTSTSGLKGSIGYAAPGSSFSSLVVFQISSKYI